MGAAPDFEIFLKRLADEGWIESWDWAPPARPSLDEDFSKSHKSDEDGRERTLEVRSPPGFRTGVDLEFFVPDRPLFRNRDWLERRLKIPRDTVRALRPEELLEEWAYREAAFKSLYPRNAGVVLSDFVRLSASQMSVARDGVETRFELRGVWSDSWFAAFARRRRP